MTYTLKHLREVSLEGCHEINPRGNWDANKIHVATCWENECPQRQESSCTVEWCGEIQKEKTETKGSYKVTFARTNKPNVGTEEIEMDIWTTERTPQEEIVMELNNSEHPSTKKNLPWKAWDYGNSIEDGMKRAKKYFTCKDKQTLEAIGTRIENTQTYDAIYTDGSLKTIDGGPSIAGSVYVREGASNGRQANFKLEGWANSTNPEHIAMNAALLGCGKHQNTINIDNMAIIGTYERLKELNFNIHPRELNKKANVMSTAITCEIMKERRREGITQLPVVKHVKGHSGEIGNEQADRDANGGHTAPMLTQNMHAQSNVQFILKADGNLIEGEYRNNLKEITKIAAHLEWVEQPKHKHIKELQDKIDLGLTFTVVQCGHKVTSLIPSEKHSHYRKYLINSMHRQLPTRKEMRRRHQDLYPDGCCRVCLSDEEETNEHLWNCPAMQEIREEIMSNFINSLSETINEECQKEDKQNPQQPTSMEGEIEPILIGKTEKEHNLTQEEIKQKMNKWFRNWMGQPVTQQTDEETDLINNETDRFSFEHVAGYGLIPKVTQDCIKKCGVQKTESTRRIIIQAWKELRYQVKEKIWKYRNEKTIEFEIACGITEKAKNKRKEKTTKKEGPRNKTETKEIRTTKNTKIKKETICQLCEGAMNPTGNHECSGRMGRIKKAIKILIEDRKGTKKIQPGWITTSSKYMSAYTKNEEFEYQPKQNQELRKDTETNEKQKSKENIDKT
ncbi:hypothetical protein BDR26DRAFT_902562 [Obelidium mucronatum]|nr:hypothetical protein BDR26DRAFT_902562 [Obelidium mucronatum]